MRCGPQFLRRLRRVRTLFRGTQGYIPSGRVAIFHPDRSILADVVKYGSSNNVAGSVVDRLHMFRMPSTLDLSKFTSLPIPSGIATKIDMDQSGSAMVQAKHEVVNEKEVIFLLSGRVLIIVSPQRISLVNAVQFPMPSEIAKGQKRNNGLCRRNS